MEHLTTEDHYRSPEAEIPWLYRSFPSLAYYCKAAPIVLKGPAGIAVSLVLSNAAAYLADSERLRAYRLADGQALWETPATINHHKPPDVFLAGGLD